ncbi:MAG: hypothetical protein ACK4XK_12260, partial [Casimicrobiaceae bacterium]
EIEKLLKRRIEVAPLPDLTARPERQGAASRGERREHTDQDDRRPPTSRDGPRDKSHFDLNPDQPAVRTPISALRGRRPREVCALLCTPVMPAPTESKSPGPATDTSLKRVEHDHLQDISA